LRKTYIPAHKFDLCLCLEVAEHINGRYSDALVDTLVGSSFTILFTAAPVGQAAWEITSTNSHMNGGWANSGREATNLMRSARKE